MANCKFFLIPMQHRLWLILCCRVSPTATPLMPRHPPYRSIGFLMMVIQAHRGVVVHRASQEVQQSLLLVLMTPQSLLRLIRRSTRIRRPMTSLHLLVAMLWPMTKITTCSPMVLLVARLAVVMLLKMVHTVPSVSISPQARISIRPMMQLLNNSKAMPVKVSPLR